MTHYTECNLREIKTCWSRFEADDKRQANCDEYNLKTKLAWKRSCSSCLPFAYHRFDVAPCFPPHTLKPFIFIQLKKTISRLVRCVKSPFRRRVAGRKTQITGILISPRHMLWEHEECKSILIRNKNAERKKYVIEDFWNDLTCQDSSKSFL